MGDVFFEVDKMGKGVRPNWVKPVMPPCDQLVVVMADWMVRRRREARSNGLEEWANGVNLAVWLRNDVIKRLVGDESLSAFAEE